MKVPCESELFQSRAARHSAASSATARRRQDGALTSDSDDDASIFELQLMGIFAPPIYALRGTLRHYALDWHVGAQSDGQYCSFI